MEGFYRKEDGIVIYHWRYKGEEDWRAETTCYKEVPYAFLSPCTPEAKKAIEEAVKHSVKKYKKTYRLLAGETIIKKNDNEKL